LQLSENITFFAVLCECVSVCVCVCIKQQRGLGLPLVFGGEPAGAGNFSNHHRVQIGSGAHPASYLMCNRDSFPGSKATGAWSWPFTSI
jgi:hypothetical protein